MFTATVFAIAIALPGLKLQTQQPSTTSPNQVQQTQASQPPCAATTGKPAVQLTPQEEQKIAKRREWLQKYFPLQLPSFEEMLRKRFGGTPCPPSSKPAAATVQSPSPQIKLPPDVAVTLKCNPMVAKDGSRSNELVLPDPHAIEPPKQADQFLVDSVVPDLSAKTPCYLIRVDPRTHKSFVAQ